MYIMLHVDIPSEINRLLQEQHLYNDSSSPKDMQNLGTMVAMKTKDETGY